MQLTCKVVFSVSIDNDQRDGTGLLGPVFFNKFTGTCSYIVFCFMLFKRLFFSFLIVKVNRTISKNQEVVTSHLSSCKCWPPQVKHFCLSHLESLQRIKDNNI